MKKLLQSPLFDPNKRITESNVQIAQKNAGMADIDVDRYQGPLREATPSGHVGFDSLPDQVVNKATGAGFCFNILCVGETGIGKRYFTLFL